MASNSLSRTSTGSYFSILPTEILVEVFLFLDPVDLFTVSMVCSSWNSHTKINESTLWRGHCMRLYKLQDDILLKGYRDISWRNLFRQRYTWHDSSKSTRLTVLHHKRTALRKNNNGIFPLIRTAQPYEGGVFMLRLDSPKEWKMNVFCIGLVTPIAFFVLRDSMVNNRVVGRVAGSFGFGYDSFKSVKWKVEKNDIKACFVSIESEYTQIGGTLIQGDYIGFSMNTQTGELVFLVNGVVRYKVERKINWPQELYPAASSTQVTIVHHCFHRNEMLRNSSSNSSNSLLDLSSESEHEPLTKKIKREPSLASFENIHQLYPELQQNLPQFNFINGGPSESEEEEESAPSEGETK